MDECEAQISSVLLQRGPYLGTCPVYDVTLRVDGAATWNGGRLVDRLGSSEAQIDVNDYNRLASFIERARFVGCKLGGFMSHQAFRGALASLAGATSPVPAGSAPARRPCSATTPTSTPTSTTTTPPA